MQEIIDQITATSKPLYIRFGLGWKGAEWSRTTADILVNTIWKGNYAHYDVMEVLDGIGISFYSANDML